MKKNILSLIFVFAICGYTQAQDVLYGGLRIAPNFSVFTDKVENKKGSGVGYSIGYFEVAELTSKINLQAEINYSTYAFVDNSVSKTTETTTLTNLELPIMVKYRIVDAFSIGAGYQFNILNQQFRTKSVFREVEGSDPTRDTDQPGSSSQGYFIDANFKTGSVLLGLRVLQNADDFYLPNKRSVNIGLYAAFAIFK